MDRSSAGAEGGDPAGAWPAPLVGDAARPSAAHTHTLNTTSNTGHLKSVFLVAACRRKYVVYS